MRKLEVYYFLFTNKRGFCKQTKTSFVYRALEALFIISENTFLVKIIEKHSKPSFETIFIVVGSFGGVEHCQNEQKRKSKQRVQRHLVAKF